MFNNIKYKNPNKVYEYLLVDEYLQTFMNTQSLKVALEIGLIDYLIKYEIVKIDQILSTIKSDEVGIIILINMLINNNIIELKDDNYELTKKFLSILEYRDLLEAKIEFSNLVAPDILNSLSLFLNEPNKFMSQSRLFEFFGYQNCFEISRKNIDLTKRWMKFTTVYTRYEARVCMVHHDFSQYRTLMDIGGNSGEFVLQICTNHHDLKAIVVDLPVVCEVGQQYINQKPQSKQIRFVKADALTDSLPNNLDAVTFKSILHDWPEQATARFIERARDCLKPGGKIIIFERGYIDKNNYSIPYSMLPMFLFIRHFRNPSFYQEQLQQAGFKEINIQKIKLEMPFFLIVATK